MCQKRYNPTKPVAKTSMTPSKWAITTLRECDRNFKEVRLFWCNLKPKGEVQLTRWVCRWQQPLIHTGRLLSQWKRWTKTNSLTCLTNKRLKGCLSAEKAWKGLRWRIWIRVGSRWSDLPGQPHLWLEPQPSTPPPTRFTIQKEVATRPGCSRRLHR